MLRISGHTAGLNWLNSFVDTHRWLEGVTGWKELENFFPHFFFTGIAGPSRKLLWWKYIFFKKINFLRKKTHLNPHHVPHLLLKSDCWYNYKWPSVIGVIEGGVTVLFTTVLFKPLFDLKWFRVICFSFWKLIMFVWGFLFKSDIGTGTMNTINEIKHVYK